MTTTPPPMPEALRLAERLNELGDPKLHLLPAVGDMLRTQHERIAALEAENKRLNDALKWEQNRAERLGTHGHGCEKWGPAHYECLLRHAEKLEADRAMLREALHDLHAYVTEGLGDHEAGEVLKASAVLEKTNGK